MKSLTILSFFCLLVLTSCEDELGSNTTVTYTKATAVYGDLNIIRQTPLKGTARQILNPGKIFISNNQLLIGEEGSGIHIIDNTNPENPVNTAFINIPGNKEFYIHEDQLYAESYYDMLKIDISNINEPILTSRAENAFSQELKNQNGETLIGFNFEEVTEKVSQDWNYFDQLSKNNTIYFDYQSSIIPSSNVPASFAGNSQQGIGTINRIAFSNDHVYVIGHAKLSTFEDNGALELVNSSWHPWELETIFPHDDKLFIGTQSSMEVYDISNASSPQHISVFNHANACDPVLPVENTAYVTLRSSGTTCPGDDNTLFALDISRIESPQVAQEIPMESPFGMSMIGDKLYVGEGENGLKIFDASEKQNLKLITWDKSIQAYDVLAHPTRTDLILVAGPEGLNQYRIEKDERTFVSNLQF